MRLAVLVLALAFGVSTVSAQPAAPQDRREKVKKRIRALRAYTLTEELALDEQTAGKLFPVLAKWDDEMDKLLQQRADVQKKLQAAGDLKDTKTIDQVIDEAIANQRALWDAEDKRLAQLRKILTPAQTARLLVVLPALERKIQNQLRKAIQKGGGPRAGRGGGGGGKGGSDDGLEDPFGGRGDDVDDDVQPDDSKTVPPPRRRNQPPDDDKALLTPKRRNPPPAPTRTSTPKCDPFDTQHGCK